VVDSVLSHVARSYVFADTARAMVQVVRARQAGYRDVSTPGAFADTLTAHLRAVSHDVHLGVYYRPDEYEALLRPSAPDPDEEAERAAAERSERRERNFGYRRVEVLDGNVGYVELVRMDTPDREGGERAEAAMALVAGADAVVLDLRKNPGGDGRMGQVLASYFLGEDDVEWLVTNVNRSRGTERQEWSLPYVPGTRMPNTRLYILVSGNTGSAAEGLAYALQAMGRAVVVGEPTAGGAHSGSVVPLAGGFVMFLPAGRVVSPITQSNWEGTGVQPDVRIEAARALEKALALVWEAAVQNAEPGSAEWDRAEWMRSYFAAKADPVVADSTRLEEFAGAYVDGVVLRVIDGRLYFQRDGGALRALMPLSPDVFVMDWLNHYGPGSYRVTFVRDEEGRVVGMRERVRHAPFEVADFDSARLSG
ncbi:MAG TPA: S41 family peptidase, partial [Rubricoccaceae bacterium]